ncbi:cell division protein ZapE [Pseudomonas sp. S75]|uniref:cell division protein ZapE n=1 Tax=unclassified Pseudomonas TaxID=196821 RepID=UPI0019081E25|nr:MULTISPECIES: cell division protein ZapE [unclassified Pseudomonas]MBJ9974341.1 cell division protein ZapE [Pseudomonas sp. S30]MBK0151729.1 cell division protein ZapE [Pseudomonas sp. S75]
MTPHDLYQQALQRQDFVPDPAQATAVSALQSCFDAVQRGHRTGGVYLWGPVGRGKTWLMDLFHRCLQVPSRRLHFHHFMAWVHRRLFQLSGTADPLQALAQALAGEIRVLCFDELFVNDIGDAIILGRLFSALFDLGVVVVATSNQPADQLYQDGFNRERFLPAIAAIEQHMQQVAVAGRQDHRLHPGTPKQRYWVAQANEACALEAVFRQLACEPHASQQPLQIGSRQLQVIRRSDRVLWCDYAHLCERPLAALDFMALCDRYDAILVSGVPALGGEQRPGRIARGTEDGARRVVAGDRELPALSPRDDSVRRFIALVDECYDRRVVLYLEAQVPLEQLYAQGYLSFAFRRTYSRLQEMQLQRFA